MSPAREVALLVERELIRNLRSAKGIILALLCVVGGTGMTLAGVSAGKRLNDPQMHEVRSQTLTAIHGKEIGKYLADAPEVLYAMLITTIALSALLAAFIGFDSISSELQHRGVRYWTVRARRSSYIVGKFVGMFAVASIMTFVMHACSWTAILVKTDAAVPDVLSWGLRFWFLTLPVSAAWCAIVTFVSALFRTPILALLSACLAWMVLGLTYVTGKFSEREALTWVYPNGLDRLLFSPNPNEWLGGVGAGAAWAVVFVAAGVVLFQRRDV
jgi:ABC-type transport system involved in multi-copper enzyme maturation permease subunit